jgi:flagellin
MATINYNFAANVAANNLAKNERLLDVTMNKLSSGQRVGVGTNEPGTLGLYNRLAEEGVTLRSGLENVNYAISSLKVVESTAMTMNTMGNRLMDLAIKASSSTMDAQDRFALDSEFKATLLEMQRMADETEFNGVKIMQGVDIKINYDGSSVEETIVLDDFRPDATTTTTGEGNAFGGLIANTAGSAAGITAALTNSATAASGETPSTLLTTIQTAVFARKTKLQLDERLPSFVEAIGRLGGQIRALEYAAEAQAAMAVGLESAASKVGDTDYATETARLASAQVISQAATAILAQANARSSTVLTLLK